MRYLFFFLSLSMVFNLAAIAESMEELEKSAPWIAFSQVDPFNKKVTSCSLLGKEVQLGQYTHKGIAICPTEKMVIGGKLTSTPFIFIHDEKADPKNPPIKVSAIVIDGTKVNMSRFGGKGSTWRIALISQMTARKKMSVRGRDIKGKIHTVTVTLGNDFIKCWFAADKFLKKKGLKL